MHFRSSFRFHRIIVSFPVVTIKRNCKYFHSPPAVLSWHLPKDSHYLNYRQTSNTSRTLVGNTLVDHSDEVGALHVDSAPTASPIDCTEKTARRDEKHFSFGIWCVLYYGFASNFSSVWKSQIKKTISEEGLRKRVIVSFISEYFPRMANRLQGNH